MAERLRRLVRGVRRVLNDPRFIVGAAHAVLVVVLLIANTIAAGISLLLIAFVVPGTGGRGPSGDGVGLANGLLGQNLWLLLAFGVVVIPMVLVWAWRSVRGRTRWIATEHEVSSDELRHLLRAPVRVLQVLGAAWTAAAILFALFNLRDSALLAVRVFLVVQLTGLTMAAMGYLLTERILRPAAVIALESGSIDRAVLPGVTRRQLIGWTTATGTPVLGVVLIGALALGGLPGVTNTRLSLTMVVLGGVVLIVGLAVELLAARAVADPVRSVRRAMERVQEGDLDVRIPIYDASDLGQLQDGFNRMAAGLQERARLRDLFGRHVGEDVAHAALQQDVRLGGEVRSVCALFVDLVGSTSLASRHGPDEVVALLNRFFAVVVETVGEQDGWVNKFQGDAALVVFGAPVDQPDAPDRALRAARVLATRLATEVPELRAGVGVSGGDAVAGYIGTEQRLEYTVIGDPINEAARLTEVAKDVPGLVAVSGELVDRASEAERQHWRHERDELLRGRDTTTAVMVPVVEVVR